MPVRFRSSAPRAASSMAERQALNLCRSGFKSLVAHHAGVKGTGIPRELRPRGLRVRLEPSALIPGGLLASHQGPEPWPRWFDPSPGSFAAAHGCGLALVRACPDTGPVGSDRICFRGDGMSGACRVPGTPVLELPRRGPDDRDLCRSTDLSGP